MIEMLHAKINQISNVPMSAVELVRPLLSIKTLGKGDFYIKQGDITKKIGIILKGVVKSYYISSVGKEYISSFSAEGEYVSAFYELLYKIPSLRYIQALEETKLICIDYDRFCDLSIGNIYWAEFIRKVIELRYAEKEIKERDLMIKSAQERYVDFLENRKDLVKRIPQNQIALYLGITPFTLSRLKNREDRTVEINC